MLLKTGKFTSKSASDAEVETVRYADTAKSANNPFPFGHEMISAGADPKPKVGMDIYTTRYHGLVLTHLDALSHMFYQGKMYNGYSQEQVDKPARRAGLLSALALWRGMITVRKALPQSGSQPEWRPRLGSPRDPGQPIA
jgi:hypothetical protein